MTSVAAYAQGTIAFGNSALTRVQIRENGVVRGNATAADNLIIGVFFGQAGASESTLTQAPGLAAISGTTAGVLVNAASVFALPGTEPGQIVSLQIRAWDATGKFEGHTDVRQVTLAPTAGPGAVIWQTASGTVTTRFTPLIVDIVPEPSTIALAVLGLGSLLLFRRRK